MFHGARKKFIHLQRHRNALIVLCQQLISTDGSILRSQQLDEVTGDEWAIWVRTEAKRRLLYYVWGMSLVIYYDYG